MSPQKRRAEIVALRDAALEDLMTTSDEELLKEAVADGDDVEAQADALRNSMREAAAAAARKHAAVAKTRLQAKPAMRVSVVRPSIDAIKRLVERAFQQDGSLGLAFRSGKRQSDEDWRTLYDDLIALGKIDPTSDAD